MKNIDIANYGSSLCNIGKLLKVTIINSFFLLCFVFATFAENKLNGNITLNIKNSNLKDVLREIKNQSQFDFIYNSSDVQNIQISELKIRERSINEVMEVCLEKTQYDFDIRDNIVIIRKKKVLTNTGQDKITVTGRVVNEEGEPLPGVNIVSNDGTAFGITDSEGNFNIKIQDIDGVALQFSYIGMKPLEIALEGRIKLDVVMREDVAALDEVVVTGYEEMEEKHVTGSIETVKGKDILGQGIGSLDELIEGKIAGLNSTVVSGAVGVRNQITIRGENSLNGNTEPLWILDGLPMTGGVPKNTSGNFAGTIMQDGVGNVMPEDIASITILKDAAAAAIYGAKAANGVIVIETKKGFRSKTKFSYSGNFGYSFQPDFDAGLMNAEEKLRYETGIVQDFGVSYAGQAGRGGKLYRDLFNGYITREEYQAEYDRLASINTNWFEELFQPAKSMTHNLSVRGGTDKLSYYNSLSYSAQEGIVEQNSGKNVGFRSNLEFRPNKRLILNLSFSGNARENKNHASPIDPFYYAAFANPYERPYDENGNYEYDLTFLGNNQSNLTSTGLKYSEFNILKEMENTRTKTNGLDVSATANIRYTISEGFTIQTIYRQGYSHNMNMREIFEGTYASFQDESFGNKVYENSVLPAMYDNGSLSESAGKRNQWSWRNQIDFSRTFGKHLVSLLVANEMSSSVFNNFNYKSPVYDYEYRNVGIPYFENQDIRYSDLAGNIRGMFGTSDGQDRTVSFLGQLRYSLDDRYVGNFSIRWDGADVIGDNNQFAPLWSVGGRWNIDQEEFWQGINHIINRFALRGSYGFRGNINRSAYPFSTITMSSSRYYGDRIATAFTYPNPSVRWEKQSSFNTGLNLGFLDNAVGIGANYYYNKNKDILSRLSVQNSTGRDDSDYNGGIVTNQGVELSANLRLVNRRNFSFYVSGNVARNKNVIEKSYYAIDDLGSADYAKLRTGGQLSITGAETGSIYGWEYAGVNPETGNPMIYLNDDAKIVYGQILDHWETIDPHTQAQAIREGWAPMLNGIPDAVGVERLLFSTNQTVRDMKMLQLYSDLMKASMKYLGRSNPKYVGGFSTSMRVKNWTLNTYWSYKVGHIVRQFDDRKNAPKTTSNGTNTTGSSADLTVSNTNREKEFLYRWRNAGDETNIYKFVTSADNFSNLHTTFDYQKGDYVRLQSASLSYRTPTKFANKLGFDNVSLTINANNLLTFTKYKGLDVVTRNAFAYPTARKVTMRIALGF